MEGGCRHELTRVEVANQQMPLHGVDMSYAFDDAYAAEAREMQYFEVFCNRGIYHKGWTAVTRHSTPWMFKADLPALDDDVWELYDTTTDLGTGPRRGR
jgi:arylsulfatase A-like enzyme